MKHLTCEFCETITEKKLTVLEATRKNKTFAMMMDAEVCPNCKEEYYDGQKLIQFEEAIKKQNDHIKTAVKEFNKK
jgi:YgiT-type zinc finger domain-containing protein